jgi:hypothetical protein
MQGFFLSLNVVVGMSSDKSWSYLQIPFAFIWLGVVKKMDILSIQVFCDKKICIIYTLTLSQTMVMYANLYQNNGATILLTHIYSTIHLAFGQEDCQNTLVCLL